MVTHSQQMATGGPVFASGVNELQGQPVRKKDLLSGRPALFVLLFFGLALSVAFPYGMGFAVFVWGIALIGALVGTGFAFFTLLQELLGKSPTFGYAPTTAYMTGKKMKKKRNEESSDSEKKDIR